MTHQMHVILTGRLRAAIDDWYDDLMSLNRTTMTGIDKEGRNVRFVSVENYDRLSSLELTSYELHVSAIGVRDWQRAEELCKARIRPAH